MTYHVTLEGRSMGSATPCWHGVMMVKTGSEIANRFSIAILNQALGITQWRGWIINCRWATRFTFTTVVMRVDIRSSDLRNARLGWCALRKTDMSRERALG